MKHFIPFIYSSSDTKILKNYYNNAEIVRISLDNINVVRKLPNGRKIWVDPGLDALNDGAPRNVEFRQFLETLPCYLSIINSNFQRNPRFDKVKEFTYAILDKCLEKNVEWLSVPQLPIHKTILRNKINKMFANITKEWANNKGFDGRLILPIVFTHQRSSVKKPNRNKIIEGANKFVNASGATGVWIVDSSLDDLTGSDTLGDTKLRSLIDFHIELKKSLDNHIHVIAGPYWALNLILWARGLVSYAAIGTGKRYRYFVSGSIEPKFFAGKTVPAKVVIPSLKRLVKWNQGINKWLSQAKNNTAINNDVRSELGNLHEKFHIYSDSEKAKEQVASFYRNWMANLLNIAPAGRALALYQDFSDAFVVGKSIAKSLPPSEGVARRPEQVAKQFMLNCL